MHPKIDFDEIIEIISIHLTTGNKREYDHWFSLNFPEGADPSGEYDRASFLNLRHVTSITGDYMKARKIPEEYKQEIIDAVYRRVYAYLNGEE